MIIKLLEKTVIDGKLREKGEIVRVKSFDGLHQVIKKEEINNDRKEIEMIKKIKEDKLKKFNKKENGKTK